jgi:hypothetical protein
MDLLEDALSMAELLIIKRDFDLLAKIATQMRSELQIQLTPFTALFSYEVVCYLNQKGQPVDMEQTSIYSIEDVRQKAKFFDLSINKLLQSIANVDKLQNDYFVRIMKFPELGRWNLHDNLGVWFDKDKKVVGNTHYAYYVFQDQKMISHPSDSMQGFELQGNEIRAFAYDMGRIIGSISSGLVSVSDFMNGDFSLLDIEIYSRDFNTNRCRTVGNGEYKKIRLFLLHVLSSIGFIIYILKKCIIRETGILLRLEYITYHYALKRLEGIKSYCETNLNTINDIKLIDCLSNIDFSNRDGLRKSDFRNCMMHFGLKNKEGLSLIDGSNFDLSLPFCGLIESQFDGMSYNEYQAKIEAGLHTVFDSLNDYLNLETSLSIE